MTTLIRPGQKPGQPAFAAPDRSLRRKISANSEMKIQMAIIQKKKTTIAQITDPSVHSVASTATPFVMKA